MAGHRLANLDRYLAAAGRSRSDIGIEPRLNFADRDPDSWHSIMAGWQREGATHFSLNTMGAGLQTAGEHIQAIRTFAEEMEIADG